MDQSVGAATCRHDARELSATLRTDGFVFFRDFLPREDVEQARREIEELYKRDLADRAANAVTEAHHDGPAGHSVLTKPTHLLIDLYAKSPALDRLFERIVTDPVSSAVLRDLVGGDIKLRGYNCTRITGEYDPRPAVGPAANPHEWHRDSYAEIGFGILLTDFAHPDRGTTALMKGSHEFPYCPRWNCLFGPPYRDGNPVFLRLNLFSRLLARKLRNRMTGAYGRPGDFYIFINDTWHGREPNPSHHTGLRILIGAFPCDVAYPDPVPDLAPEVLAKLPPAVRKAAPQPRELAPRHPKPIIDAMVERQKALARHPLFALARWERKLANRLSAIFPAE